MSASSAAWAVLLVPLAGAILIGFLKDVVAPKVTGALGTLAIAVAFGFALVALFDLLGRGEEERQIVTVAWDYASTVGLDAELALLVDPLSVFMALVVTGVSTLIHLYAFAYMDGDAGYRRFFAYLNFFVFSMLLLVLAANFLILIIGWAFVGAASYLLISYWYRRRTATAAGIKAFVINVIGDIGLVLGTFFIFRHTGTVDFLGTFEQASEIPGGDLTAGLVLLLVGAFAKSAQIPFHTWLADAMEGPTPVSALIHAATMVTAGVYLIARMHPLFEQSSGAAAVGAIVGAVTLLVAGTIGLAVTDLKRVIAYSTMSQIGYMIMAVSAGAYVAGLFHLMTHAFFKALLFMAAGSLISAMGGIQNLDRMGGFRKAMPFTFACFVIGGLALTAIPPFSGFFSKDEILYVIGERGGWYWALYVAGYVGAFITGVYTWRMIFRAFLGDPVPEAQEFAAGGMHHPHEPKNEATGEVEDPDVGFPGLDHHAAERSLPMKLAMGTLAVLSVIGGVVLIPKVFVPLDHFLEPTFAESTVELEEPFAWFLWFGFALSTVIGLAGIAVAYRVWVQRPGTSARVRERFSALHRVFVNKWFFDEAYDRGVVGPLAWFGRFAQQTFERLVVQGALVGGSTGIVRAGSAAVRALQSGYLRAYAGLLLLGVVGVAFWFLLQAT